jgi:hypothetical protein
MLLMILCGQLVRPAFVAFAFLAGAAAAYAGQAKPKPDAGPQPVVRIEVGPLGFVPPSRAYLRYRYASATLDFIDSSHLLFTFRDAGLMHRVPDDPPDDQDQVIHAEVLDIATGKPVEQTQWRMHDRARYLWPLRDGRFMVRERNSLFLTDRHLELRPYVQFDNPLRAVELAPDRDLMVLEIQKPASPDPAPPTSATPDSIFDPEAVAHHKKVSVLVLHPGENTVLAESETRGSVDLPLVENGFLNLLEGKDPNQWVIEKELFHGSPQILGEVRSSCMPTLIMASSAVALSVGCPPKGGNDHMVNAYSLNGQVLWQDRWKQRYIWPTFEYAEDGSRFALGSLEVNRDIGFMDYFGEEDVSAQMVGVFDTKCGKLELVKDASPVLSAGRNYALSSDGRRFAILRNGAIEVYDLPAVPVDPVATSPTASSSAPLMK